MRHSVHRDQIHRDIQFDPLSIELINTPQMQRLGRVYQLGYAHLVYRGGTHTRLSHVMGVAAVAEEIVENLRNNYFIAAEDCNDIFGAVQPDIFLPKSYKNDDILDIDNRWRILKYLVKWAALLHDIGHIPMGHTLEDEFSGIYIKHDSIYSERIPYLWYESDGQTSEIKKILTNRNLYPSCFKVLNVNPDDVWKTVLLICLYKDNLTNTETSTTNGFIEIYNDALKKLEGNLFHQYMADIVADTICADYIDYIQRDTLNVGLDTFKDGRILRSYYIGIDEKNSYRMALSLKDRGGKPRVSTITAAKNIVRQRYNLAEIIYYHKTKVSASAMLAKVFALIDKPLEVSTNRYRIKLEDIDRLTDSLSKKDKPLSAAKLKNGYMPNCILDPYIGDESLLLWMLDSAWEKVKLAQKNNEKELLRSSLMAISLIEGIAERKLYKVAITINFDSIRLLSEIFEPKSVKKYINDIVEKYRHDKNASDNRDHIENEMSTASQLPLGSFLTYIPPPKSQAKGIETGAIGDDGIVRILSEHSTVSDDVERLGIQYQNLWKVIVFVHPDYRNNIIELSNAIDSLLSNLVTGINLKSKSELIKDICWFKYIPIQYRSAAIKFKELNINQENKLNNLITLFNRADDEYGPDEYAYRAYLSNHFNSKKINEIFPKAGDVKDLVKKEIGAIEANTSDSKTATPDIDNEIKALDAIRDKINNNELL